MRTDEARLAAYYDAEADTRAGRELGPLRVRYRETFIDRLQKEARRRVVEFGCGPGHDASAFRAAGLDPVGLDLSHRALRVTRAAGVRAVKASFAHVPFARRCFAAGWAMSTLMHVPAERFDAVLAEVCAVLEPGAPLGLGLWGGRDWEGLSDQDTFDPPRLFSLRSHDRAREALSRHGELERFETQAFGPDRWEYQFAILRIPKS